MTVYFKLIISSLTLFNIFLYYLLRFEETHFSQLKPSLL